MTDKTPTPEDLKRQYGVLRILLREPELGPPSPVERPKPLEGAVSHQFAPSTYYHKSPTNDQQKVPEYPYKWRWVKPPSASLYAQPLTTFKLVDKPEDH